MIKIKVGDRFVCIKKVVMIKHKTIEYKKGFIYISKKNECIENESKETNHNWTDCNLKKYFLKIKENE